MPVFDTAGCNLKRELLQRMCAQWTLTHSNDQVENNAVLSGQASSSMKIFAEREAQNKQNRRAKGESCSVALHNHNY